LHLNKVNHTKEDYKGAMFQIMVQEIVALYIKEYVIPKLLVEISDTMEVGMKAGILTGENPVRSGYGYDMGELVDSLIADPAGKDTIVARYQVKHGEYIQYGTKQGIKPVDFFGTGLKHIKKKYGA